MNVVCVFRLEGTYTTYTRLLLHIRTYMYTQNNPRPKTELFTIIVLGTMREVALLYGADNMVTTSLSAEPRPSTTMFIAYLATISQDHLQLCSLLILPLFLKIIYNYVHCLSCHYFSRSSTTMFIACPL